MKIGLIGCGYFGKIHAKCIKEVENFDLFGIYDTSSEVTQEIAKQFGTTAYFNLQALIEDCDVVDIVANTTAHFELAKQAIVLGKHCFIEKPITATVEEAEELVRLARKHNVIVQVGHVERYNPAFIAAIPHLTKPLLIETNRLCNFNLRGADVSVVHDLMIHDIDLVLSIMKSKVVDIQATGYKYLTDSLDFANARLFFAHGGTAHITASRISNQPIRKMCIYQPENYITANFQDKKVEKTEFKNNRSNIMDIYVIEHNAIVEELSDFLQSIQQNRAPKVTIMDGLNALNIADKIVKEIFRQKCIKVK